ncbi:MAG: hypothetical protein HUJ63_13080 [Enterococcus sp.]|nr:hypothetical protein [Enterococcus sp.]
MATTSNSLTGLTFTQSEIQAAAQANPPEATLPAASAGPNDPQKAMYEGYRTGVNGGTFSHNPADLKTSLEQSVYDPWGAVTRPEGGREYSGQWVNPYDQNYTGEVYRKDGNGIFKYNQMLMTVAQNFDPFMQRKEMVRPHWWLNRIPRGAYTLFNGAVQETRIFRGGLSVYSGLGAWEDLAPDPTSADACAPIKYKTYQYAWETLAWSGKKTAWGSDPFCIETMKFIPKAVEQLGWILETGVKFGTDIQNIWNRDMFIFNTVQASRSFVMTSEYRGDHSPRYVYQPFCKLDAAAGEGSAGHAEKEAVTGSDGKPHPFILIDASAGIEPLNFDVLDLVRNQLKRRCPDAAVGRIGNELMFALAVSEEDVEKYIRGNEEERKYWIEANPQALIQHYGFAPTTFRRWTITCDDDQLRFKLKTFIPKGTTISTALKPYGYVGQAEFSDGNANTPKTKCDLWVAVAVDPEIAGRPGVNGSPIPVPNPEYDVAEIAVAPVFMNRVFTNLFVPDVTNLGSGTWFGPKKGLNGKWAWYNIQTPENPDNKIGNFKGEFQIVPKPDVCVYDCISFVYRRCSEPLPALCPSENVKVNPSASGTSKLSGKLEIPASSLVATIALKTGLIAAAGDKVKFSDVTYTASSGSTTAVGTAEGYVYESLSNTRKNVQITAVRDSNGAVVTLKSGSNVVIADDASVDVA